jgi:hypothetical protein
MSQHPNALVIPPEAEVDPKAGELLRAWVSKGGLHCSLKPTVWEDPGSWGILLADVARHVASALQESGKHPIDTLERIRRAFQAEMEFPTEKPTGSFHHEH